MESDPDDRLARKVKRSNRLAIASLFLLALTWRIDAFFFWLFLGLSVYFLFLVWYYKGLSKPQEPEWQQQSRQASGSSARKVPLGMIIAGMTGLLIAFSILRAIFSGTGEAPIAQSDAQDEELRQTEESDKSNDATALIDRGNGFYNQGSFDSALVFYNRALAAEPSNQYAMYDKALVYYSKKSYDRSVSILLHCLQQYPDYAEALWLLGDTYLDRSRLDSAKVCFDQAYGKGLRNGQFLQGMASLYEKEDRSRAVSLYKESLQQDSSLVESYRKLMQFDPARAGEYQRLLARWDKIS